MRFLALVMAMVALAACTPAGSVNKDDASGDHEQTAAQLIVSGQGLAVSGPLGTTLSFGSPRETVEVETAKLAGPAVGRSENDECGVGPMQFTAFPGGLTLNFQEGQFVGWFLNGEAAAKTDKGTAIGDPMDAFVKAHEAQPFEDGTLGIEYFSNADDVGAVGGEGPASDTIDSLFAGTNCFFR